MYKVFFKGSTIQLASKIKKSSKNNIVLQFDSENYDFVNQLIVRIESENCESDFWILNHNQDELWTRFKSGFTEIPAAGGLVQNLAGAFLFIDRLGVWDLPKGKIEQDETPEMAAVREVEEECGLGGLKVIRQLESTYHIYRSPYLEYPDNLVLKETKWFLMNYSGDDSPVPQKEEDILEARWFAPSELNEAMNKTYSSLRNFLQKALPSI
jgi:8-oxo-dGTP pyrophosphatase MutT (NUDIX family)